MMDYYLIYAVQNKVRHIQLCFWLVGKASCYTLTSVFIIILVFVFFLQSFPFFGVVPAIVDEHGNELEGACEGFLVTNNEFNHVSLVSTLVKICFNCWLDST